MILTSIRIEAAKDSMYWLRTGNFADPLIFLLLGVCWAIGGALLVAASARFRKRERMAAGIAFGLLLYILLGNVLAHFLPVYAALFSSAILILVAGLLVERRTKLFLSGLVRLETGLQLLAIVI